MLKNKIKRFLQKYSLLNDNNIYDINGLSINVGDFISYNYFYWQEGSSEDYFHTEPQNSWWNIEAYIEENSSIVSMYKGSLCVKCYNEFRSLKEIIEQQENLLDDFAMMHKGEELDIFLQESVFENRTATIDEVKNLFSEFEIIK
jgi:hypothetical protein